MLPLLLVLATPVIGGVTTTQSGASPRRAVAPKKETNSRTTRSLPAPPSFWERFKKRRFGVEITLRGHLVPKPLLTLFMAAAHSVVSETAALSFIMHNKGFNLRARVDYWRLRPTDGVWLAKGYRWASADYASFGAIHMGTLSVHATWVKGITERLSFLFGLGIGGGYLEGSMKSTKANGCSPSNYDRVVVSQRYLGSDHCYRDNNREFWSRTRLPHFMGVLEGSVGLRYTLSRHLALKLDGGISLPGGFHTGLAMEHLF